MTHSTCTLELGGSSHSGFFGFPKGAAQNKAPLVGSEAGTCSHRLGHGPDEDIDFDVVGGH